MRAPSGWNRYRGLLVSEGANPGLPMASSWWQTIQFCSNNCLPVVTGSLSWAKAGNINIEVIKTDIINFTSVFRTCIKIPLMILWKYLSNFINYLVSLIDIRQLSKWKSQSGLNSAAWSLKGGNKDFDSNRNVWGLCEQAGILFRYLTPSPVFILWKARHVGMTITAGYVFLFKLLMFSIQQFLW